MLEHHTSIAHTTRKKITFKKIGYRGTTLLCSKFQLDH